MDSRLPHPRQIQARLQALGDEIQSIREEYDGHMAGLGQRLREAENRQRQLRDQLETAMSRTSAPPDSSYRGSSSPSVSLGSRIPPSGSLIATGRNMIAPRAYPGGVMDNGGHNQTYFSSPGAASAGYNGSLVRPTSTHSSDLDATPRPQNAVPQSMPAQIQQQQQQQQQRQGQQPVTGSKDNAAYLPMVMENIMAEHRHHKREGTLRYCGFVSQDEWGQDVKCPQDSFHMPCFRANHFYYCRQHMRVIPGGKTVCSHRNKHECLLVVFEDRDDWDGIVDAALAAGNLGNKGVDVEDLNEALFPPQDYPHRYMGVQR